VPEADTCRSAPPSCEMVNTPFPFRTKAMLRPSGDQAGLLSESGVVVSRRSASLPTAFRSPASEG